MSGPAIGVGEAERVAYALELVSSRVDLAGLRVLDLACCHGAFTVAFAAAGAKVLGMDGRQSNLDHAPTVEGARYALCDVRDLSLKRHGRHDVALCMGILYHLEPEDALRLLTTMRKLTTGFAVIDTHVGADHTAVAVDGRTYRGAWFGEAPDQPRSSIGNRQSWWFTEPALRDAVEAAGWSQVEPAGPAWPGEPADRRWLVVS